MKYAEDTTCTLELTKGNFYITLYLRACFFIWWVKQGMFGCGDDPPSPPQTSGVETIQAVLETREEAVFKRMLHPLQTVHIR